MLFLQVVPNIKITFCYFGYEFTKDGAEPAFNDIV